MKRAVTLTDPRASQKGFAKGMSIRTSALGACAVPLAHSLLQRHALDR